ncbi:MAG: hypothetical protein KYX64_01490 [Sphingopyxis sp.]|nr:hypothetical protein [Sphingopyxis sp.]
MAPGPRLMALSVFDLDRTLTILPTFEYADKAIAVDPSTRLLAIAAQRGWPALDWRQFHR